MKLERYESHSYHPYSVSLTGGNSERKYDYSAAFNMFDESGKGTITVEALKLMLIRLQIVNQIAER